MSAVIFDGRSFARKISSALAVRAKRLARRNKRPVRLAILCGEAGAPSASYLKGAMQACATAGIQVDLYEFGRACKTNKALSLISRLAKNPAIDAILIHRPLPAGVAPEAVWAALPPQKDAEGLAPDNLGQLFSTGRFEQIQSRRLIAPCTALAVAWIAQESMKSLSGKRAVIIGRSTAVGRTAAHLLSALDATITLCHSKSRDLALETRRSDIIVAALGKAKAVRASWIKPGAVLIDVGVNSFNGRLCGDIDFGPAQKKASFITPVPGGVGPVTTAALLANVVSLAERRKVL